MLLEVIKSESNLKQASTSWVFPLLHYNYRATGGSAGNGYISSGYNYFDGNRHGGHPAHDIFINDRNQDCIDDKTHQPVEVLAVADGIVIACCNNWKSSSKLRGGKYIWIYHQQLNLITYYAHNDNIFVKPGDEVKAGQQIAFVGRTGYNAYKKRSPTHLHFSSFHIVDGKPVPFNGYEQLKNAKTS
jgi:murein DD-endopeptidase MepM/ murein hydrolase activator NlpD